MIVVVVIIIVVALAGGAAAFLGFVTVFVQWFDTCGLITIVSKLENTQVSRRTFKIEISCRRLHISMGNRLVPVDRRRSLSLARAHPANEQIVYEMVIITSEQRVVHRHTTRERERERETEQTQSMT